jgi:peptide deformylase
VEDLLDTVQVAGRAGVAANQIGVSAAVFAYNVDATVAGWDAKGDPVAVSGQGELARCFQHETGHLRGELYIDRLDGPERAQAMRRLREQLAARR